MADEAWLKFNLIFGSAGMAASGMVPLKPAAPKPVFQVQPVQPAQPIQPGRPVDEAKPEKPKVVEPEVLTAGVVASGTPLIGQVNWEHAFFGISTVKVAAAADPDPENLEFLVQSCGIPQGFADYREMLARTKPRLVMIPQEETANRHEIIKNCLMSGSHVVCPAPFTRTLAEADELISLADRRGLKIAVANPMRVNPNVIRFLQMRQALIGDLVEIRILGKMDETSGGEDLLRHGAPLFDLARMFAGDPLWCTGHIFTEGRLCTCEDIDADPARPLGPTIADSVTAQFYTANGVFVHFVSNPKMKWVSTGWGMEFVGTHRVMRLFAGDQPELSLLENPGEKEAAAVEKWNLWPENLDPYHLQDLELEGPDVANRLVVLDWLNGISEDRAICCSADRARRALEMVHGVWKSGLARRRVEFPLRDRSHPLEVVPS